MKPINLKLKGLNSYMEEQEIDFESLCSKGLFGIFGPTGCGKSTILDGITIALYGASGMARDTKDFINTEEKKAIIKYVFSLKNNDGRRIYDISRSFKNSKTGVSNDMAKLIVSDEYGEIIEVFDKAKEVNTYLEDLLGLTAADFMRSVVLPQGKFSDFLKLKDADRRRMIERLLNLQEFGVKLADKIKRQKEALKSRIEHLDGSINALASDDDESIEIIESEVKVLRENLNNIEDEYKKSSQLLEEVKELYKKTNELNELNNKLLELDEKNTYIENLKNKLLKADEASHINPIYIEYDDEKKQLKELSDKLLLLNDEFIRVETNNTKLLKVFEEKTKDKEEKLPLLVTLEAKLIEMSKLAEENENSKNVRDSLRQEYKILDRSYEGLEKNYNEAEDFIKKTNIDINNLEDIRQTNYVDSSYKTISVELKSASERCEIGLKKLDKLKTLKLDLSNEREKVQKEFAKLEMGIDHADKELKLLKEKQITDDEIHSKKTNDFHKNEKQELELRNIIRNYKEKLNQKDQLLLEKNKLTVQLEEFDEKLKLNVKELGELEKHLENTKTIYEKVKIKLILNQLTGELIDGKECPLCGSKDHPHIHEVIIDSNDYGEEIDKLTHDREKLKSAITLLERDKESNTSNIETLDIKIKELKDYTNNYYNDLIKEKEILDKDLSLLNESLQSLDRFRNIRKEEILDIENKIQIDSARLIEEKSKFENLSTRASECHKSIKELEYESKELKEYINESLKNTDFNSVSMLLDDILKKEDVLKEAESKLKLNRSEILLKQNSLKEMQSKKDETYKTMTSIKEKGTSLSELIRSNSEKIRQVTEIDPREHLRNTKESINEINETYKRSKNEYEENNEKYTKLEKEKSELSTKLSVSSERSNKLNIRLDLLIEKSSFESLEHLKKSIMADEEKISIRDEFEHYDKEKLLLNSNILKLKNELKEESCDKEKYDQVIMANEELGKKLSLNKENLTIKETKLSQLEKNAAALKLVIKEKNQLLDKQGTVNEISKLTNGNKFVEFVAINHLRYIAKDASTRLIDITNGRYSLELDHNGAFVICDNYNGGVKRSCQSLSGGETFMTSLSLALALSTHIQLKGAATLEFFILDEGFGTLDVDLLDTVMNSLEKLRSKNISVGVISHVEELKNRVPMRLSVTPAEPGLHGTRVKIESN